MREIKRKIYICLVLPTVLLQIVFTSCNSVNPDEMTEDKYYIQIDDSVYLNSFPSEVYLELGKSILIENSGTAFRFIDILEYDEYNSSVALQVEYSTGELNTIVLNTNDSPRSYTLGNGYNHEIELKNVFETGGTYLIMFTYYEYTGG